MEEIGTCIATKLAECLWDPISQGAHYLFRFKQFIGDLGKAKEELEVKLEDLNKRKEEADRKTEEIMPSVKKWLHDVKAVLEEVQKLQQEVEEGGKKCFNVSLKYSLAKKMEDKAKQMIELKNKSNFEPFSQLIQLPGIGSQFSSKKIMDFRSRKSTYNSLLEAIKDGKNNMVGLYGMGGSGKTTLAIEAGKKVEQLFDKVIKVIVSRPLNVRNIQEEVKGKTGLTFNEMTESTTAQRLLIGLKRMKILIILDDVWSNLDLEEIGIPLHENCSILLTTRNRDVCESMRCDRKFELSLLTKEEAWDLFKIYAKITNDSLNEFVGVGEKIVSECKGLPIAIVTVGSALRGKGIVEWESALWRLQHSLPLDIDESSRGPYACLKLSYDNLPSPLAQSLFLLCSMFPEDHEIHIEDLIRFAKGAFKFEEISSTMDNARSEILTTINRLLDSCLLMHTDEEVCVKMHDLVRDVALWITKKPEHRAILVDSQAVLRMMFENEGLEETKVISLWNLKDNFKLSNQLRCPTLEILLLHPEGFIEDFGGIVTLRVLALVTFSFQWWSYWHNRIQWSPQSTVSSLINLHTICFRGIELDDISFLCQFKRLEILDLRQSNFNELPAGIVHMKRLKLLDVFGCTIEKSPLGVIEKCEQLEELYFWDYKSAIQENFSLSRLKRYVIYDSTCRLVGFEPPFLQYFDEGIKALRALCIQGFEVSTLNSSMKDLIFRANYLWLENCLWDYKDISFEIKHLVVSRCPERRFIVDASFLQTGQVLPHLITLRLIKMDNLEQVFSHATLSCHCPPLKELKIEDCPKLDRLIDEKATQGDPLLDDTKENLYGNETVSAFVVVKVDSFDHLRNQKIWTLLLSLKVVTIERSGRRMKGVFEVQVMRGKLLESEESVEEEELLKLLNSELCIIRLEELPVLEYIWKGSTQSVILHRLEDVKLSGCPKLRNIFTTAVVTSLPELEKLHVFDCEEWEGVFCEESLKNLSPSNVCFPKLQEIGIRGCNKVKRLFPYSLASHCPSLEELYIRSCFDLERLFDEAATNRDGLPLLKLKHLELYNLPKLRYAFGEGLEWPQQKNQNGRGRVVNLELCDISLEELPVLECIWKGPTQSVSLHRLKDVKLSGCAKLHNIFTAAIVTRLPELKKLHVFDCEEWEGVFCEESLKNLSPSNVCFPKLQEIEIWGCNKVKRLIPYSLASHCPSLYKLDIKYCFELERLFDEAAANRDGLPLLKLERLDLYNLPKLRDIFGEGLECPQQKNQNERGRVVNSELWRISLEKLQVLECIWKGPTQSVSLYGLESVRLQGCPKVKNIFTLTIVMSLPMLTHLIVSECNEWEGIFCEESLINLSSFSSSSFNVCFPKLKNIQIRGCNKVKWLFSYSLASYCPSLQGIEIEDCYEIEGVVEGCEGEVGNQGKLFPSLKRLSLKNLPKLRDIYKGYESNLLYGTIRIQDCPSIQNIPQLEYKASSDLEIKSEN